jgi:hypothetical protein
MALSEEDRGVIHAALGNLTIGEKNSGDCWIEDQKTGRLRPNARFVNNLIPGQKFKVAEIVEVWRAGVEAGTLVDPNAGGSGKRPPAAPPETAVQDPEKMAETVQDPTAETGGEAGPDEGSQDGGQESDTGETGGEPEAPDAAGEGEKSPQSTEPEERSSTDDAGEPEQSTGDKPGDDPGQAPGAPEAAPQAAKKRPRMEFGKGRFVEEADFIAVAEFVAERTVKEADRQGVKWGDLPQLAELVAALMTVPDIEAAALWGDFHPNGKWDEIREAEREVWRVMVQAFQARRGSFSYHQTAEDEAPRIPRRPSGKPGFMTLGLRKLTVGKDGDRIETTDA